MKVINHLVVVSANYPSPNRPTDGTFVRNTVRAFSRQGIKCTVIHPTSSKNPLVQWQKPVWELDTLLDGHGVTVCHLMFFSLGAKSFYGKLGPLNPTRLATACFHSRVKRILDGLVQKPDALYGHFIHFGGVAAAQLGRELNIPSFVRVGESSLWTIQRYGWKRTKKALSSVACLFTNSSSLRDALHDTIDIPTDKIHVITNGIDPEKFHPRDKKLARQKFGFHDNEFLVISVGHFDERKGLYRVAKAIDGLMGVGGVFVGKGPLKPTADNIRFMMTIDNEDLPELLSACDVFALPTLIEGSCNAIVEAMACGLPVISSNGTFNNDLLTPEISIRLDPLDVNAIRDSVIKLRDNPQMREQMSRAALEHAKKFDINDRVRRMIELMGKRS